LNTENIILHHIDERGKIKDQATVINELNKGPFLQLIYSEESNKWYIRKNVSVNYYTSFGISESIYSVICRQSCFLLNKIILYGVVLCILAGCDNDNVTAYKNKENDANAIPVLQYSVIRYFSHDTTSYTEGLLFHNGSLFESTGSPDDLPDLKSVVGMVDLTNGRIGAEVKLSDTLFGEGIVFLKNKLYQLTYKHRIGFVYDAGNYKLIDSFPFASNEGWGLTTDGTHLIMSDGTSSLTYIDPNTYKAVKVLRVTDNDGPVMRLNELEYVKGFIYANIYTTSFIVKIDPGSGRVVGRVDLSSLDHEAKVRYPAALEMNGIAYDSTAGTFYVTGKMWPNIYEISFPH
jgi:glutaminyl-peptide cyclotransferase